LPPIISSAAADSGLEPPQIATNGVQIGSLPPIISSAPPIQAWNPLKEP